MQWKSVHQSPERGRGRKKINRCPSLTAPLEKFLIPEVDRNSLNKAKIEKRLVELADAVEVWKIKIEDRISTKRK